MIVSKTLCLIMFGLTVSLFLAFFIIIFQTESVSTNLRITNIQQQNMNIKKQEIEILKTEIAKIVQQIQFECENGDIGILNDDYCDCIDGKDEPNTSACSHILVHKKIFKCSNSEKLLFSSRVHDGISDCSDGSDEQDSRS